MDKCRVCLKQRKKLRSIFDKEDVTTYVVMLTTIANIKILNDDGFTDKICLSCRKKLREAYEFKILIERSDTILHEMDNLKRIHFNNIYDIKIKIEIDTDCKPIISSFNLFSEKLFENGDNCIAYNDTLIKKINRGYDNDLEKKPLSVMEFLETIKTETNNNYYSGMDDYDRGDDSDFELNVQMKKKKNIGKKFKTKLKRDVKHTKRNKYNNIQKFCSPIKPVYLKDIRVMPSKMKKKDKSKIRKRADRRNICPYCGKLAASLNQHILVHIGERTFKCDKCSKGFFTASALKTHTERHSDIKNFKCEHCIAAFSSKTALHSHMLMHTEAKNHVCDVCSKAFKRLGALKRHIKIHSLGYKSIKCDLCNMSFSTKYSLRHHLRVHTGERPYKCEICSQPYSYKHDFNRHCYKKHGIFLKRRSVYVMNEEVLKQERALMRDLMLRAHGILKDGKPLNPFEGPQAAMAFEQAIKAIEAKQIPIDFNI